MAELNDKIRKTLKDFFGYDSFKGEQEDIILHLLGGGDSLVLMPTGGGKSLCFQLPAIIMEGTAIVISPLISLMKNQVDVMRGYEFGDGSIAHFLNSSLNRAQLEEVRADLISGKTKILYVAPETLTKEDNVNLLRGVKISFYAVDEAHCISEWGHDFRVEYRRIRNMVDQIGRAPIIALTATATPKVQSDILKSLGIKDARIFKSSFNRYNIFYEVRKKDNVKEDMLRYIVGSNGKSGIVYCLSRKTVEELSEFLNLNNVKALPYHAGLDAKTRAENQDLFLTEKVQVVVATIAFGMGIDKPDVRFVIHYDIPKSIESYYQETGRAGRDGQGAHCIAYYKYSDIQKFQKFLHGKPVSEQEISKLLLEEVVSYAESGMCRRKILLNYFGEEFPMDNCKCCDNCTNPVPRFDGKNEMTMALRLVDSLPEHFKKEHLANILVGNSSAGIQSYNHHKHPLYGAGKSHEIPFWLNVLRQAVMLGFLDKEIKEYGTVRITEKGRQFLATPYKIDIVADLNSRVESKSGEDDPAMRGDGSGDPVLMKMLKGLRTDLATKNKVPSWAVFGDPALNDMCISYPITIEGLRLCRGVGEGKAKKYGEPFVQLIKAYVEENDILRPDDFVVKSAPSKSKRKIYIIDCIDRQMDLEDIAEANSLEMDELLKEMESIVSYGTSLNLDYYIKEHLDEDEVEEIFDYFQNEAESDSLSDALAALGRDFDDESVRLVRMKFLCEAGL